MLGPFGTAFFLQEVLSTILKADQEDKVEDENGEASSAVCVCVCLETTAMRIFPA